MNQHLTSLLPYPFERLAALKEGIKGTTNYEHVSLALGEPKHETPALVIECLADTGRLRSAIASYPATRGTEELREAISHWLRERYGVTASANNHILPVNGTREGLFSFGQAVLSGSANSICLFTNPFYQIYEGAAFLRGATPYYVPGSERPDFESVPEEVWQRTELVYLCSPGNPTGVVADREMLEFLINKAQESDFIIAADECYSEIYLDESSPPLGLLEIANNLGYSQFNHCVAFNSLSKRSNCPGLRSGFVAGDAFVLEQYYQYRTYHGCAMPIHVQEASAMAWRDESHVVDNRAIYRRKFEATQPLVSKACGGELPEGAFYYWLDIGIDDELFASQLFKQENITVLPGRYLGREVNGENPGSQHIRVALVAPFDECVAAIRRMCDLINELRR